MQAFQRVKVLASPVLRAATRSMGHDVVPKGFNVPRAKYIVGMVQPQICFFVFERRILHHSTILKVSNFAVDFVCCSLFKSGCLRYSMFKFQH